VNHSFGQTTFHKIIAPFLEATFKQPDDGGHSLVFLQELGINEIFEGREPSAEVVAQEAFQQLTCAPPLGRQSAQDSLTRLVTSPKHIEQDAAKIIEALIASWRADLCEALRQHFPLAQMSESGKCLTIRLSRDMPRNIDGIVSALREAEYERADWTLRLIAARSCSYRRDLAQAKNQLRKIYGERLGTSIKIIDSTGEDVREFELKRISLAPERRFLSELEARTAAQQAALQELRLPPGISDFVGTQLLNSALHEDAIGELKQLQVPEASLQLSPRALQDGTPAEYVEIAKKQAAELMQRGAAEARVFLERASFRPQRCVSLAAAPQDELTMELQVAQIAGDVRSELVRIVRDSRIADRLASRLLCELNAHILESTDPFAYPWLSSYNIEGADAKDGQGRIIILAVCPLLRERPWYSSESDDSYYQPLATLKSEVAILADRPDRSFLDDGSVLMRWLGSFNRFLKHEPTDDRLTEEEEIANNQAGGVACFDGTKGSSWRYYGLTHEKAEEAFNSPLNGPTDCATDYQCSFFDLLSERYSAVWQLLPADNFYSATIAPIEQHPPLTAAIQTFQILERHYGSLQLLSEDQQGRLKKWLECYQQWADASTIELLLALPSWRLAADLCLQDRAILMAEEDVNGEGDEEDYGWSIDTARSNEKLFGRDFSNEQHHILQSALEPEAVQSVNQLLSTGHIYFDRLSAECIVCLNERSHAQIKEAIISLVEDALALKTKRIPQDWFDLREQNAKSSALALRSSAGRMWAVILERSAPRE
jgi:hypothetical protein